MDAIWLNNLTSPNTLVVLCGFVTPIVVMICVTIITVTKMVIRHRERMGMIKHGICPDEPPDKG